MKSIELIARRVNPDEVRFSSEDHAQNFVLPVSVKEGAEFQQGETYKLSFTHVPGKQPAKKAEGETADASETDKQTSKTKK